MLVLGKLVCKTFTFRSPLQPALGPGDHYQTNFKPLSFFLSGLGLVRGTRVRHSLGQPGRAVETGTGLGQARLGQDWRSVSFSVTGAGTDSPRLG